MTNPYESPAVIDNKPAWPAWLAVAFRLAAVFFFFAHPAGIAMHALHNGADAVVAAQCATGAAVFQVFGLFIAVLWWASLPPHEVD